MPQFLENNKQRAALLITLLGVGLVIGLWPFASGLLGGVVLYVMTQPLHRLLARYLPARWAGALVVSLILALLILAGIPLATLIATQAHQAVGGVIGGPVVHWLSGLEIWGFPLGPELTTIGDRLIQWIGENAFRALGTATLLTLNLAISLFVLYYLLLAAAQAWAAVSPYIPFSFYNAEALRVRFWDVTASTIIGTGLTALVQGCFVALGFVATGLSNAAFWGVVTVVLSILPLVGSGMIWGPGVLVLAADGRYGAAFGLFLLGVVVVANVDLVIRPLVFRRYAHIHPLVTLVGAIAGVRYLGLLGLLLGPLAISYFFELIRMYKEEYLTTAHGTSN
jgi:predicted PurR-regulated permease PerM